MAARERPILFSAPMVRAILEGRKTQTRRVVKPQPDVDGISDDVLPEIPYGRAWRDAGDGVWHCPYGQPGDRLWVRETTHRRPMLHILTGEPLAPKYDGGAYSADDQDVLTPDDFDIRWWYSRKVCPAIHMPRWASRIDLDVTGVRVERLQDVSEADAIAEGLLQDEAGGWYSADVTGNFASPVEAFRALWESIYGADSWDANPWVWAVEFRRIRP